MATAILAEGICKTYRTGLFRRNKILALNNVSLRIEKGELVGLLGPNGAGKTTLLSILSLQLIPDCGKLTVLDFNTPFRKSAHLKFKINMSSGNPNFSWSLTVKEILTFYAMLYGLRGKELHLRVDECLDLLLLKKIANQQYESLSTGGKQRLALAKAIINRPELLFLDEPTIGLDPDIARQIRTQIQVLHQVNKTTILLTTHYMKEAEDLCQRIYFIKNGKILTVGTPAQIREQTHSKDMEDAFIELAKSDVSVQLS